MKYLLFCSFYKQIYSHKFVSIIYFNFNFFIFFSLWLKLKFPRSTLGYADKTSNNAYLYYVFTPEPICWGVI